MLGGLNFNSILLALLNLLIGGVLVTIIRTRVPLKKIANEREANLLTERAEEMGTMRAEIAELRERMEVKDRIHEAQRAYDRHRINNLDTALKAFFIMVKRHPDDAAGAAQEIEAMRATQVEAENREAIALRKLEADLTTKGTSA